MAFAFGCAAAQAAVDVRIEGLDDDLADAVRASLQLTQYASRPASPARVRYLYGQSDEQIRAALEPFGYYSPTIDADLEPAGDDWRATFRVEAGSPVTISAVNVDVRGLADDLPAVQATLAAFGLGPGDQLDHEVYESGKRAIDTAIRGAGYLDATLAVHRVAVNTDTRDARVDLEWDAGPRYRIGDVRFSKAQFDPEFLRRFVPWGPDEHYTTDRLLALQQRLVEADYFATVSVTPVLERRQDGRVPVDVILTPDERNVYAAALYYSTDFGAGARLRYQRRWLNPQGHRLESRLEYSQRLEEYAVTYAIPKPGPKDRTYTAGFAYRDEESDTAVSRSLRAAVAESRKRWRGWARTLSLQYLRGDFEIADVRGRSTLLYVEGALQKRRLDDLMFPRDGYSVDLGLRYAPGGFVSDTSVGQVFATGRRLLRVTEDGRLILGLRLGAMTVGDFDALPPELRFFAGGDRSLRGFDYQAIGEVDDAGRVIGGRYLAVGTVEYEHYFLENWGAAVFSDVGDAFSDRFDANVSVGVGLRWRSPIGMVRVDVAKPVETRFAADGVRVHIMIGPDL